MPPLPRLAYLILGVVLTIVSVALVVRWRREKRAGYPAFTEAISTSRGTLWRVRVGPYPSREAAAQSRDKLKAEGHAGIVVPAK